MIQDEVLSPTDLIELAWYSSFEKIAAGKTIKNCGDEVDKMYVILSGKVGV